MGAKGEAFAGQFEAKVEEATILLEKLTDADWKKTTAAEKWTVAVTAHHIASSYEPATRIIETIAAGRTLPHFTRATLDEMNAQHAREFAGCTKAETIALLKKGVPAAAAVVRGLTDDQLAKSGTVFTDAPPMTAEQLITRGLIIHIDEHVGSIRKAVGH